MTDRVYNKRKTAYVARMNEYLETYKNILIISADNVGSNQMQQVRMLLRGRGVILMGKNTVMRKVIRDLLETKPELAEVLSFVQGNIGFVFTNDDDLEGMREVIESRKVPAAARPGSFAPIDVFLPPGPTPLDPGQTSFFQAMNIATKINRGAIEIINTVHLIKKGDRVSSSAVALLSKLAVKPFNFSILVTTVYENGVVYDASILDLAENDMLAKFFKGVNLVAAICMETRYPTEACLVHYFANAFERMLAVSLATDYTFEQAQIFKDYLANPDAFKSADAGAAGGADASAGVAVLGSAPAAEESEDETNDGVDLFGGDDDDY